MEDIIGKRAYKKTGFFAGLIGKIEEGNKSFPGTYVIKFENSGSIVASLSDMVIIEDKNNK